MPRKSYRRRRPAKKTRRYKRRAPRSTRNPPALIKLKQTFAISTTVTTGNIAFGTRLYNPTEPDTLGPTAFPEWSNIVALYDFFKPCGMKIQWIPDYNTAELSGAAHFKPMHTMIDWDLDVLAGGVPTVAAIQEYGNSKMRNMARPWKQYIRLPRIGQNVDGQFQKGGYFPTTANGSSLTGLTTGSFCFNTGVVNTTATVVGSLQLTMYIAAKNRR